jgi:hypothetical protein
MDTMSKGKKKPAISKMFQSGQDALKPYKVSSRRICEKLQGNWCDLGILHTYGVIYTFPEI